MPESVLKELPDGCLRVKLRDGKFSEIDPTQMPTIQKTVRKARLLTHWQDVRHPYRDRFLEKWQPLVDRVLSAPHEDDNQLDADLQAEGLSLRVVVKEIPPVFGSFW